MVTVRSPSSAKGLSATAIAKLLGIGRADLPGSCRFKQVHLVKHHIGGYDSGDIHMLTFFTGLCRDLAVAVYAFADALPLPPHYMPFPLSAEHNSRYGPPYGFEHWASIPVYTPPGLHALYTLIRTGFRKCRIQGGTKKFLP